MLAALTSTKVEIVKDRLAARQETNSEYSWQRFADVMGKAGVDVEAVLQPAAPAPPAEEGVAPAADGGAEQEQAEAE